MSRKQTRIAIDVQHLHEGGFSGKNSDLGATWDGRIEAYECVQYAATAKHILEGRGYQVFMTDPTQQVLVGPYKARHEWVQANGIHLYFACHLNSNTGTPGNYGRILIGADASEQNVSLAKIGVDRLKETLGLRAFFSKIAANDRGHVCIRDAGCLAFLLEPYFINNPMHRFPPERVAQHIVDIVEKHEWMVTQEPKL